MNDILLSFLKLVEAYGDAWLQWLATTKRYLKREYALMFPPSTNEILCLNRAYQQVGYSHPSPWRLFGLVSSPAFYLPLILYLMVITRGILRHIDVNNRILTVELRLLGLFVSIYGFLVMADTVSRLHTEEQQKQTLTRQQQQQPSRPLRKRQNQQQQHLVQSQSLQQQHSQQQQPQRSNDSKQSDGIERLEKKNSSAESAVSPLSISTVTSDDDDSITAQLISSAPSSPISSSAQSKRLFSSNGPSASGGGSPAKTARLNANLAARQKLISVSSVEFAIRSIRIIDDQVNSAPLMTAAAAAQAENYDMASGYRSAPPIVRTAVFEVEIFTRSADNGIDASWSVWKTYDDFALLYDRLRVSYTNVKLPKPTTIRRIYRQASERSSGSPLTTVTATGSGTTQQQQQQQQQQHPSRAIYRQDSDNSSKSAKSTSTAASTLTVAPINTSSIASSTASGRNWMPRGPSQRPPIAETKPSPGSNKFSGSAVASKNNSSGDGADGINRGGATEARRPFCLATWECNGSSNDPSDYESHVWQYEQEEMLSWLYQLQRTPAVSDDSKLRSFLGMVEYQRQAHDSGGNGRATGASSVTASVASTAATSAAPVRATATVVSSRPATATAVGPPSNSASPSTAGKGLRSLMRSISNMHVPTQLTYRSISRSRRSSPKPSSSLLPSVEGEGPAHVAVEDCDDGDHPLHHQPIATPSTDDAINADAADTSLPVSSQIETVTPTGFPWVETTDGVRVYNSNDEFNIQWIGSSAEDVEFLDTQTYDAETGTIVSTGKKYYYDCSYSHNYKVRGQSYLKDGKKIDAGPALCKLMSMESFESLPGGDRTDHIASMGRIRRKLEILQSFEDKPFVFLMNLQLPGDPPIQVVTMHLLSAELAKEVYAQDTRRAGGLSSSDASSPTNSPLKSPTDKEKAVKLAARFFDIPRTEKERFEAWGIDCYVDDLPTTPAATSRAETTPTAAAAGLSCSSAPHTPSGSVSGSESATPSLSDTNAAQSPSSAATTAAAAAALASSKDSDKLSTIPRRNRSDSNSSGHHFLGMLSPWKSPAADSEKTAANPASTRKSPKSRSNTPTKLAPAFTPAISSSSGGSNASSISSPSSTVPTAAVPVTVAAGTKSTTSSEEAPTTPVSKPSISITPVPSMDLDEWKAKRDKFNDMKLNFNKKKAGLIKGDITFASPFELGSLPLDSFQHKRFKLIPSVVEGPWVVQMAVRSTPVLLGQKVALRYFRGVNYFEMDLHVGSSSVGTQVVGVCRGYVTAFACHLGVVIQGESAEELPEKLLSCVCMDKVDLRVRSKIG